MPNMPAPFSLMALPRFVEWQDTGLKPPLKSPLAGAMLRAEEKWQRVRLFVVCGVRVTTVDKGRRKLARLSSDCRLKFKMNLSSSE